MRDLLFDLVRRTRRPESTVQPRLPSAYEASRQAHDLIVDEDVVMRESAPAPPPMPTNADEATAATPMPRERRDPSAIDAAATRTPPPAHPEAFIHDPRPVTLPSPVARAGVRASTVLASPVAVPAPVPVAAGPIAQASAPRTPAAEIVPRVARVVAPIQPATRVDLPPARRGIVDPAERRVNGAQEPPAPDIRISIGRIEVRATAPERTPARRQASTAPPLTLDDYLAARARKGTR